MTRARDEARPRRLPASSAIASRRIRRDSPPASLDVVELPDGAAFELRIGAVDPAMGRFGDVLLVAGEPDLTLGARLGEVVRLDLTNTANTRVFRVKLPGARMKRVGGDSGRCEREQLVEDVVLAPSERTVVDVLFDEPDSSRWSTTPRAGPIRSQRSP